MSSHYYCEMTNQTQVCKYNKINFRTGCNANTKRWTNILPETQQIQNSLLEYNVTISKPDKFLVTLYLYLSKYHDIFTVDKLYTPTTVLNKYCILFVIFVYLLTILHQLCCTLRFRTKYISENVRQDAPNKDYNRLYVSIKFGPLLHCKSGLGFIGLIRMFSAKKDWQKSQIQTNKRRISFFNCRGDTDNNITIE